MKIRQIWYRYAGIKSQCHLNVAEGPSKLRGNGANVEHQFKRFKVNTIT